MKEKHAGELTLYVDSSGVVWTCSDTRRGKSTNLTTAEFVVSEKLWPYAEKLRILGLPQNAGLIVELCQALGSDISKLELGTPAFCRTLQLTDPADILRGMSRIDGLPPSLGGWHRATHHDLAANRLIQAVGDKDLPRSGLLEQHPAFTAISFIPNYSRMDAEHLLASIGDPRWFVDLAHPERTAKLRSWLGLHAEVITSLWNCDPEGLEKYRPVIYKAWSLLDTWTGAAREVPSYPELDQPGHFVWRRFCEFPREPIRGALRASAYFLSFVCEVWLDALSPQELFVPKYFFTRAGVNTAIVDQDGSVAVAFRDHCQQQTRQQD